MDALPVEFLRSVFINLQFKDLFENLHYDPMFPENRNIRIKSLKRQAMEIYKNQRWNIVSFDTGLNDMISQVCRIFRMFYRKNRNMVKEDLTEDELEELLGKLEEYENFEKSVVKPVFKELKYMMENYRDGYENHELSSI